MCTMITTFIFIEYSNILYIDFEKAYTSNTVTRRILYYILRSKYKVPDNVVDLIRDLHEGLAMIPRVNGFVGE